MDDLIVAIRWQNQIQIVLSNEFDLKLFQYLMHFTVLNRSVVPARTYEWTFAMPKGGLSWFKWSKADLSKGIDNKVFNYVASGDIEALPHLNYNELIALKNGNATPKRESINESRIGNITINS